MAPISIAAYCAQYYYNRQKQLPHTLGRYVAIGMGSMFLSMFTYRGQFRKRVAESPLSTPYLEALRKNLGIQCKTDYFGAANELNQISQDNSSNPVYATGSTYEHQHPFDNQNQSFESGFEKTDDVKPVLSYEELRARNRGYAR